MKRNQTKRTHVDSVDDSLRLPGLTATPSSDIDISFGNKDIARRERVPLRTILQGLATTLVSWTGRPTSSKGSADEGIAAYLEYLDARRGLGLRLDVATRSSRPRPFHRVFLRERAILERGLDTWLLRRPNGLLNFLGGFLDMIAGRLSGLV